MPLQGQSVGTIFTFYNWNLDARAKCTYKNRLADAKSHYIICVAFKAALSLTQRLDSVTNSTYSLVFDSLKEVISECCGTASQTGG